MAPSTGISAAQVRASPVLTCATRHSLQHILDRLYRHLYAELVDLPSEIVDIPPDDALPLPLPPPPNGRAPPTGRATSTSSIIQHLHLIQLAISSITVGQFEDRVYAILMRTPPGAKLLPRSDNTGTTADSSHPSHFR